MKTNKIKKKTSVRRFLFKISVAALIGAILGACFWNFSPRLRKHSRTHFPGNLNFHPAFYFSRSDPDYDSFHRISGILFFKAQKNLYRDGRCGR